MKPLREIWETKMDKYWQDENKQYGIDFNTALDVMEIHEIVKIYTEYISDADIIVEDMDKILFIEYKNSNIENAAHPENFTSNLDRAASDGEKNNDFRKKLAKKFYGTLFTMWACDKNKKDKPIHYVLLFESNPGIDDKMKKAITFKMRKQLPFQLKGMPSIKREVISDFEILNFADWAVRFPDFKIKKTEN